jgi:hypothetical protein
MKKETEETHHEQPQEKPNMQETPPMTRGPRPHRALSEAIPIAKARGIIQMAQSEPERVFDIAIISKVPVTFARIMFAPEILATIQQFADDFKEEIAQLRIIARDAATTALPVADDWDPCYLRLISIPVKQQIISQIFPANHKPFNPPPLIFLK